MNCPCTSRDGVTWECGGVSFKALHFRHLDYFEEPAVFVASGPPYSGGTLLTSVDGTTWTECGCDPELGDFGGSAYGNGTFVVVGARGNVCTSRDGRSWQHAATGGGEDLLDVAFGRGTFVAVGALGVVFTSRDGLEWERQSSYITRSLSRIVFGGDLFVAVGQGLTIATSPDGKSWTKAMDSPSDFVELDCALYAKGQYWVSSGNLIYTSDDAVNWTEHYPVQGLGGPFIYTGRQFVGTGHAGFGLTVSDDGLTWDIMDTEIGEIHELAWDGSSLFASCWNGIARGTCIPYITGVQPLFGQTSGGETVTIKGGGLSDVTTAYFGDVPTGSIYHEGPGQIGVVTPAHRPGDCLVTVESPEGRSLFMSYREFPFLGGPTKVYGWAPPKASSSGWPYLGMISGEGLDQIAAVYIGGVSVTFERADNSDRDISFDLPYLPAGMADLTIYAYGQEPIYFERAIDLIDPPVITGAQFFSKPARLRIGGSNFKPPCEVRTNGRRVGSPSMTGSDTIILRGRDVAALANEPALEIVVTNADGISSETFTFSP